MESIQTPPRAGQGAQVIALLGPTASGKTSLAIRLAKKYNGEIISLDSRQIYTGLDIGTEKVTVEEMEGVSHHLIDIAQPTEIITVAEIQERARTCIAEIVSRGNIPILAGGTGMYFDAVLYDISFPEVPPNRALRETFETQSTETLFTQLSEQDPRRAQSMDPANRKRIVRALEIIDALGKVPETTRGPLLYDTILIGLEVPREVLQERITKRLRNTLEKGLIAETQWLLQEVPRTRVDEFGLEYRIVAEYLEGGFPETELIPKLEQALMQYAKRQMTWFRKNEDIIWLAPENVEGYVVGILG